MKKAQLNYFQDIITKNWQSEKIYKFNNNKVSIKQNP